MGLWEDIKRETKKGYDNVTKPVQSLAKEAEKVVQNVVTETGKGLHNVVKESGKGIDLITPDITIAKEDVSIKGLGKLTANVATIGYDSSIGLGVKALEIVDAELLNDNLNIYSGGLLDDLDNVGNLMMNLAEGEPVEEEMKSLARVGAIAAAVVFSGGTAAVLTTLGTAGMSQASWGQIANKLSDAYLPDGLGDIFENVIDGPKQVIDYVTNYTPSDAGNPIVLQDVVDSKIIPIMVITVVLASSIILLKKKKK